MVHTLSTFNETHTTIQGQSNLGLSNIPSYNSNHHSSCISLFLAPHLVVSVVDVKVEDIPGLYVCIALMGVISVRVKFMDILDSSHSKERMCEVSA